MGETWLLIETSGRVGRVGLAQGGAVIRARELGETRRMARDLAPTVGELLQEESLAPAAVHGVMASIGPGSYTGLRVGLATAKTFAYATGCKLIAVPTFSAIALHSSERDVLVVSDALQGQIYRQRFSGGRAADDLRIEPATEMDATGAAIVGPWVKPGEPGHVPEPALANLLQAGLALPPLDRDAMFALEPLYLRGSSAEEKVKRE